MRNADRSEQRRQLAVWVQVAGAKGDGAFAVLDEMAGDGTD